MQISNLNAIVEVARSKILSKYNPEVDDLYLKTLDAAYIHEEEYSSHAIHDEMDVITQDIRKSHAKDSNTAPEFLLPLN